MPDTRRICESDCRLSREGTNEDVGLKPMGSGPKREESRVSIRSASRGIRQHGVSSLWSKDRQRSHQALSIADHREDWLGEDYDPQ